MLQIFCLPDMTGEPVFSFAFVAEGPVLLENGGNAEGTDGFGLPAVVEMKMESFGPAKGGWAPLLERPMLLVRLSDGSLLIYQAFAVPGGVFTDCLRYSLAISGFYSGC